jgi:hypothetical protein
LCGGCAVVSYEEMGLLKSGTDGRRRGIGSKMPDVKSLDDDLRNDI